MKKLISVILLVVFVLASALPASVFAATDSGLEQALKIAKEKITVPEEYKEFSYSMSSEGLRKVWNLSWRNKDDKYSGNLNIRIDDQGIIESYHFYNNDSNSDSKKLPQYSLSNAEEAAKKFLNKVNPGLDLILIDNSNNDTYTLYNSPYRFYFVRSANGIPLYSNNCSIEVNRNTCQVESFYLNWTRELQFPDASKAISLQQAQKAYIDNLGLKLAYKYYTDENQQLKVFPVYMPKYNNYSIDAITGEKIITSQSYYGTENAKSSAMMDIASGRGEESIVLSPEEIEAVEKVSNLLSQEEAEAIARNFKPLELTQDFSLRYSSLEKAYQQKDAYLWDMSFTNEGKDSNDNGRYANITLNAATGEIKNFRTRFPTADKTPIYDKATSKAAVEKFLKEINNEKFSQTVLDENVENYYPIPLAENEMESRYSFRYTRLVNGIQVIGNYINAEYDAINGKVVSYSVNWLNTEFPAINKVLPIEKVNELLFEQIGLELQYSMLYGYDVYAKYKMMGSSYEPTVKLVYSLKNTKPALFDANSGIIINNDGEPFKEKKPIEYTDIKEHYAQKQISILAQYGIALEGNEFKPDEAISQKDYLYLVLKSIDGYWGSYPSSSKGIDEMYYTLMKQGYVKEGEKSPDLVVFREEAVKFMIRALKYDKVAEIKDIFKCNFKDADDINSELIGYVAIASGLKIIQGSDGYFSPSTELTRAQAMVMIYNYLSN